MSVDPHPHFGVGGGAATPPHPFSPTPVFSFHATAKFYLFFADPGPSRAARLPERPNRVGQPTASAWRLHARSVPGVSAAEAVGGHWVLVPGGVIGAAVAPSQAFVESRNSDAVFFQLL